MAVAYPASMSHTTPEAEAAPAPWFALKVRTGYEQLVAAGARNKGFEEFLPLYESRRLWSDRFKTVRLPLFPGYVFCRFAPERRLPLLTIPGVQGLVSFGRNPTPVDEADIRAIQTATRSGVLCAPWPYLETGQRVRIKCGPLAGLEGILLQVQEQHRIVLSITLLKRSVVVEIERDWVTVLDSRHRPLTDISSVSRSGERSKTC
jgi:transcription antitermination factor NusG